jgi:nitroimidazol reductase NimA-like FMN-containing flavoprotein (pyridoxamine 5'-phosphate oxidase superfamily)
MRRKDKAISDVSSINAIIKKAAVCRLAMVNGDRPYIVPLCFGHQNNVLYFHGAMKGQKIDLIQENPNVCFEFDVAVETLDDAEACSWSMKFQSVIGFGKAELIQGLEEKRFALGVIMAQYSDKKFEFPEKKVNATAVIKVAIESLTAKQSGFS